MLRPLPRKQRKDSNKRASTEAGAVHPLFLWGILYVLGGLPVARLGLIGWLSGWDPLSFGPDGSAPWSGIAIEGLVPLCLGCLVLFGMVVLTVNRGAFQGTPRKARFGGKRLVARDRIELSTP